MWTHCGASGRVFNHISSLLRIVLHFSAVFFFFCTDICNIMQKALRKLVFTQKRFQCSEGQG